MAFIPTAGVGRALVTWQDVNGIVAQNSIWAATETIPTETDLEEIGDTIYDVIFENLLANTSANWSLTSIVTRAMNEAEGLEVVDANSYPQPGTVSTASTVPANQVSYTCTLSTGLVGRSARGRIYGVGLPNGYHNGVRLDPTSQGVLDANWALMRTALETNGHAWQVVSFQTGGVPRTSGRPLPVLSTSVRFPLATQRRRLS